MVRNLDHRIEAAVEITDKKLKKELRGIINIQLNDSVKARRLDNQLSNNYVHSDEAKKILAAASKFSGESVVKKRMVLPLLHLFSISGCLTRYSDRLLATISPCDKTVI